MSGDDNKRAAAARALDYVEDGMKLGLGTGSTAAHFVDLLGRRVAGGLNVLCVPTSEATRVQAAALDITLGELDGVGRLDLTVDGADEFDDRLRLIKGGGGALLREKIVAAASDRMIVIADDSKQVDMLGAFALPVEVVPFGAAVTALAIADTAAGAGCGGAVTLRKNQDGVVFRTDGGHVIYDCALGAIARPEDLAEALNAIPGVVEHGLFIGLANRAIVGSARGVREIASQDTAA